MSDKVRVYQKQVDDCSEKDKKKLAAYKEELGRYEEKVNDELLEKTLYCPDFTTKAFPFQRQETLDDLADILDDAVRCGNTEDDPEGTRYAMFSDTILKQVAARLRAIDKKLRIAIYG